MLVLLMGSIYELTVEMGSGAMIYMPRFIKIGFQKLIQGDAQTRIHTETRR
jgi:hypothetical protein